MNLSRNFVMLFFSLGYQRDSLLYLCTAANLAGVQAATKCAYRGFLYDHPMVGEPNKLKLKITQITKSLHLQHLET